MEQKNHRGHPVASKVVLVIYDAIAVNLAYFLTFMLRFCVRFEILFDAAFALPVMKNFVPIYAVVSVGIFCAFRLYVIRWEYCGLQDMLRIVLSCLCTGAFYAVATGIIYEGFPRSIYFIAPFVEMALIGSSRIAYKLYLEERNRQDNRNNASKLSMIVGADSISRFAVKYFEESKKYRTVVMIDPDNGGSLQYINGIPVVNGLDRFEWALDRYKVNYVVITDNALTDNDRKK